MGILVAGDHGCMETILIPVLSATGPREGAK
jgi:hypothetical protein